MRMCWSISSSFCFARLHRYLLLLYTCRLLLCEAYQVFCNHTYDRRTYYAPNVDRYSTIWTSWESQNPFNRPRQPALRVREHRCLRVPELQKHFHATCQYPPCNVYLRIERVAMCLDLSTWRLLVLRSSMSWAIIYPSCRAQPWLYRAPAVSLPTSQSHPAH